MAKMTYSRKAYDREVQRYDPAPAAVVSEGGTRRVLPAHVIQGLAHKAAINNPHKLAQRCSVCEVLYEISYIRQVRTSWRRVEPVCVACCKIKGYTKVDFVK